ncbi:MULTISPECIES: AraC family transcriptional regulator [unclassified Paenibacillus]|jgi:AraC-like DNA-binding protein|uniref:AraC family transcriptional regulator n=1 Tax=unclassified Paenibacillus TaxID=185978 RepID=UPI00096F1777|nr:AraC family transcriptional regulator [Paenibacillus sp. FSL H7-0331]OMF00659.1 AraC family transcriptional regulator [Paenibacillus sp. FSL H7-0331]
MSETVSLTYGSEEGDFYMQHIKRTELFERNNHFHSTYEIYYLLSGHRTYFIKDRSYLIGPGDLVFINKYDVHKTSDVGEPGHERIVINFSDKFIDKDQSLYHPSLFNVFEQPAHVLSLKLQDQIFTRSVLDKLDKELKEKATGFETYIKLLLVELLLFSSRYAERNEAAPFEHASPLHRKISEIVQYINKNYAQPMTLSGMSEQFYMSPYYMSRTFKEITGFTFIEYVNMTRIREAQLLLRESTRKIIDIADSVGFENIAHFGRMFKKLTKLTPHEYRKLHRQ